MTNEFKKVCEGIFCFFLLSIQWTTAFPEEANRIVNHQIDEPRAKLGEACLYKICEDNLYCNDGLVPICQCQAGFKIYNNECIPTAGENEPCIRNEDCCGRLICINEICRKPGPSSEFVTLAKICLGITVTTIIIAVFSSIIKCLFKYDNSRIFQRHSDTSSFNSILPFRRQFAGQEQHTNPETYLYGIRDEKPPSYEECIRSPGGRPIPLEPPPPPPYIISTNTVPPTTEISPTPPPVNLPTANQQNLTTPLNVQSLSQDINSNAIGTERSQNSNPATENKPSS